MASGRPADDAPVIPRRATAAMTRAGFNGWRGARSPRAQRRRPAARARPYDLRHSFASLLLHEGRDVIYVARQLGHGAELTLRTYGHVIEELEDSPQLPAEDAIRRAREDRATRQRRTRFVPRARPRRRRRRANPLFR